MGFRPSLLRSLHDHGQTVAGKTRDIHGIQRHSKIDKVSAGEGAPNGRRVTDRGHALVQPAALIAPSSLTC